MQIFTTIQKRRSDSVTAELAVVAAERDALMLRLQRVKQKAKDGLDAGSKRYVNWQRDNLISNIVAPV